MPRDPLLNVLADSYLDHVLLALRAGDAAAKLRNFLDPWWVFERGGIFVHARKTGGYTAHTFDNPCPWVHRERLMQFDWCSEGANAIVSLGRSAQIIDRKSHPTDYRLVVDHAVPLAAIGAELWREPHSWTRDSLRLFLQRNLKRALISYREDRELTKRGLAARMPSDWAFGKDPFARYAKIGISGTD